LADPNETNPADKETVKYLAIGTVIGSLIVVVVLAGLAIGLATDNAIVAKEILTITFPVVSTWVGTVLAYYFSRENYVAVADKNMQLLALTSDAKLQSIRAASVMIPIASIKALRLDAAKSQLKDDLKTKILDGVMKGVNRLPILNAEERVEAIVHRSECNGFIVDKKGGAAGTLQELLDDPTIGPKVKAIATVGRDATLSDAKNVLAGISGCADVFVTETGRQDGRVLGWITNVIIAENAKV
jgi:hypothetical protein